MPRLFFNCDRFEPKDTRSNKLDLNKIHVIQTASAEVVGTDLKETNIK